MSDTIRIAVCDCKPIFRYGLQQIVETVPDMEIVSFASCYEALLAEIEKPEIDVLLIDIDQDSAAGLDCLRCLHERRPELGVLVFTACEDRNVIIRALGCGIRGFKLKHAELDEVLDAMLDHEMSLENLAALLNDLPGVIDHGLFLDEADEILVDRDGQIERIVRTA